MAYILDQRGGKTFSLPAKIAEPQEVSSAFSPLAWKILKALAERPTYPKEIARQLRVHEQKVYYHIRNLEKQKLIERVGTETKQGALAKIYAVRESALALLLKPLQPSTKISEAKPDQQRFLEPFIAAGRLNALIVVGSPEPHGETGARAKDGPEAATLAAFLGTFLSVPPEEPVQIDTQLAEKDLKNNLILIGGPGVNSITAKINNRLPVRFQAARGQKGYFLSIYSSASDKTYKEEEGLILKIKNPFDKTKEILVISGKRRAGTKAAVLAFLRKFDAVCAPNKHDKNLYAHVVEGLDTDSDGIMDDVAIRE